MKKLLVVADYQKDFVDGAFFNEEASAKVDSVISLIETFETRGDDVVFTIAEHSSKDYLHQEVGRHCPRPHAISGSEGVEVFSPLKEKFSLHRIFLHDGVAPEELLLFLKKNPYWQVVFVGMELETTILSTALLAQSALPMANIVVADSLCFARNKEAGEIALHALKSCYVDVLDLAEVLV